MKKSFFFFLFSLSLGAQEVGYYYSADGKELDQFLNMENSNIFNHEINTDYVNEFAPGTLYYKSGEVTKPELKFYDGNKLFRKSPDFSKKLILSFYQSFTILKDSFIVIDQNRLGNVSRKSKDVVLAFVDETEEYILFTKEKNGAKVSFLKNKATGEWTEIKKKSRAIFSQEIISKFRHVTPIVLRMASFDHNDIVEIIKTTKYYESFLRKENIYFKNDYTETLDAKLSDSYAKINSVVDSIWNISFFTKEEVKTMDANYSSLFPFNKEGECLWYFPNGKLRQKGNYKAGEEVGVFEKYQSNGHIQSKFEYVKGDIKYVEIYDENGVEIPKSIKQRQRAYDNVNNREVHLYYENNGLVSVAYLDTTLNKYVYLLPETTVNYKNISNIKYPKEAKEKGISGQVAVKFILDDEGNIIKKQIVNNPPEVLKGAIMKFLNQEKNLRFKTSKYKGNNVYTDFIFVFNFSINSSFRNRYFYNWYFHNHHIWQMQMHMQSIPSSVPGF